MLATVLSQLAKINDLLEHNAATNAFLKKYNKNANWCRGIYVNFEIQFNDTYIFLFMIVI